MSKKFDKIVVHMGPQKTGSSSIQKFYFENRTIIAAESDVYYPSFNQNHGVYIRAAFKDLERYRTTLDDASKNFPDDKLHTKAIETIDKELLHTPHNQVFLSGESISLFNPEQLRELHTWLNNYTDNIQLFGFARNPLDWHESLVSEKVKQGETLENAIISSSSPFGFRMIFKNMATEFGENNFEIFDLESKNKDARHILECVHKKLGIKQEVIDKCVALDRNQNTRISMESVHLLSSLNTEKPLYINGSLNPKRSLDDVVNLKGIAGNDFHLSGHQLKNLKQQVLDEIKWLSDNYDIHYTNKIVTDTDTDTGTPYQSFSEQAIKDIANLISELTIKAHQPNPIVEKNEGLDTNSLVKSAAKNKDELAKLKARAESLSKRLKSDKKDRIENSSKLYKILKPLFKIEKSITKRLK